MKCYNWVLFLFLTVFGGTTHAQPVAVYLTWLEDPSHTMHVGWVTHLDKESDHLSYRKMGTTNWLAVSGSHQAMPLDLPYLIHHVDVMNLDPDQVYEFQVGTDETVYRFQTLPEDPNATYRFIVGGDMYCGRLELLEQTNRVAAAQSPMFVVIGGDIAYAHEKLPWREEQSTKKDRWIKWLKYWSKHMVTPEGNIIPLLPAIGNHDVIGHNNQTPAQSPVFYALFPFPGDRGYNVLDITDDLSIVLLDSGHTHNVEGEQTEWLASTLAARSGVKNTFAVYHVPAFPGGRKFDGKGNVHIRKHWVPLFELNYLTAAFEHHDHCYKRTHRVKNEMVDPDGVLYLGDGGWGVKNIREPKDPEDEWYLAKTAQESHFILITVTPTQNVYQAINNEGLIFDELIE